MASSVKCKDVRNSENLNVRVRKSKVKGLLAEPTREKLERSLMNLNLSFLGAEVLRNFLSAQRATVFVPEPLVQASLVEMMVAFSGAIVLSN